MKSANPGKKKLSAGQREELLSALESRFAKNMSRHKGVTWAAVEQRLAKDPAALKSLAAMEASGGEPDVIAQDKKTGEILFWDCSPQSPDGRRSLCYDREALESRKAHKPKNSAVEMARSMGIELLTEDEYRQLQKLGEFDTKTSSWIETPSEVRSLGGALFCDRRFNKVFVYHNGAESYYAGRGFRGKLRV